MEDEIEKEIDDKLDKEEEKIRIQKKTKKLQNWEMLRWTVAFIEENKNHWEEEKKTKIRKREEEELHEAETWYNMSREEK